MNKLRGRFNNNVRLRANLIDLMAGRGVMNCHEIYQEYYDTYGGKRMPSRLQFFQVLARTPGIDVVERNNYRGSSYVYRERRDEETAEEDSE